MKRFNQGTPIAQQGRDSFRQGRNNAAGGLAVGSKCNNADKNIAESGTCINPGVVYNKDSVHHPNQSLNIDKPPHLSKGQLRR